MHLTETLRDKTGAAALLEYSCGPAGQAGQVQAQPLKLLILSEETERRRRPS